MQTYTRNGSLKIFLSTSACLPHSPSPPSALTCSALFYPSRHLPTQLTLPIQLTLPTQLTSPLLPRRWRGPFTPLPSPQKSHPRCLPRLLPGDPASGHHSSLLPFKGMERRRLLLSLTKKQKGSKSYLPIREFAGLTYSGPREF